METILYVAMGVLLARIVEYFLAALVKTIQDNRTE